MSQPGEYSSLVPKPLLAQVSRWLRGIQVVCFVGAGLKHAHDIWQGGWFPYAYAPPAVNVFWTTLVAWDTLTAGLLLWRPRVGVVLALLLMVTDVAVNSFVRFGQGFVDWYGGAPLQLQTLFLGFVAGAAPLVWLSAVRPTNALGVGASGTAKPNQAPP
jgi:hypothetical protein